MKNLRIVLYSHDTMGLGHVRRNLLIAQVLSTSELKPDILLVSGAWETSSFLMPFGVESLILPSLYKEQNGRYSARRLRLSLEELTSLREKIIYTTVCAFNPDIVIVDNVARGANHELDLTLDHLRANTGAVCVLGLRDILDDVVIVRREWLEHQNYETILKYYDEMWVYGDPEVYNLVQEYGYPPEIASKVRYTGYLDQRLRLNFVKRPNAGLPCPDIGTPGNRFALCMVGGGQDGFRLAEAFLKAGFPKGVCAVLLAGPHMDPQQRDHLLGLIAAKPHSGYRIYEFVPEPSALLQRADCVISMGGYNSVSEILSFGKPILIVPRVIPRKEQLIRAERLKELGLADMLSFEKLTPQALTAWISSNVDKPAREFRDKIDMAGLKRIPLYLTELLKKSLVAA